MKKKKPNLWEGVDAWPSPPAANGGGCMATPSDSSVVAHDHPLPQQRGSSWFPLFPTTNGIQITYTLVSDVTHGRRKIVNFDDKVAGGPI